MSTAQKNEEESARYTKRFTLKALNVSTLVNGTVVCCPYPLHTLHIQLSMEQRG